MFGTTIIDAYKKDEVDEIVYALDDLCSPRDNYGWHPQEYIVFGITIQRRYII